MEESHEGQEVWVFMTLVVGFGLSFLVSVAPHYSGSYQLDPLLLALWIIPYLVMSIVVWFMPVSRRLWSILGLVGIQLLTTLVQRVMLSDPSEMLLHLLPLLLAVLIVLGVPQLHGRLDEGPLGGLIKRLPRKT